MDSGLRQPAAGAPYQGPYQSCDGGQRRPAPTADAARRSLSPGADHQRCGAAQPLSAVELVLPAGWRVAGGLPSSRALCLGGPHAPRYVGWGRYQGATDSLYSTRGVWVHLFRPRRT